MFPIFLIFFLFSTSFSKLTPNQKQTIIDYHNELRNQIASGLLTPPKFSLASNMAELVWDDNLERLAQTFADKAIFAHNPSRVVPKLPGYIGENIYWSSSSGSNKFNVKEAINSWFNEHKDFDSPSMVFIQNGKKIGHFTQIVWATTKRVGCGLKTVVKGKNYQNYFVCNYHTGGNFLRQKIYENGAPCSKCKCSSKWKSLCAAAYLKKNLFF